MGIISAFFRGTPFCRCTKIQNFLPLQALRKFCRGSIYQNDGIVQSISDKITTSKPGESLHLKGLCGSLDTVLMSALLKEKEPFLIICEEKEEAQYIYNDLQALIGDTAVTLFPMSHKKPYEWEEVDNANVLLRAEVLNILSNYSGQSLAIVSYPAAMTEKVI
ncbi:MAG: hypothetical protein RLZZ209_1478, partial [Bacteroidota bacterium]